MSASDDEFDPHAGAGAGIAEDRRARIVRRFVYAGAALAVAGLILFLNGWGVGGPFAEPFAGYRRVAAGDGLSHGPIKDFTGTRVRMEGRGYLATPDDYGPDFTVTYEYRFPDAESVAEENRPDHNTGCLLFITGEDKVWPRCLEVQGKWSETARIKSNARDVTVENTLDEAAREAVRKPPGEWNRVEIVSRGGGLRVRLNGKQVASSGPTELTRGRIGFQAEGFPVEFRGVTIDE